MATTMNPDKSAAMDVANAAWFARITGKGFTVDFTTNRNSRGIYVVMAHVSDTRNGHIAMRHMASFFRKADAVAYPATLA